MFSIEEDEDRFYIECVVEEAHNFMGKPLIEQIAKSMKAVIAKATSLIMEAGSSFINNNLFIGELLDDMDEFDRSYNPLEIAHIIKLFINYIYTYNTKMKLACYSRTRDTCDDPCEWNGRCYLASLPCERN